MAPRHRRGFGQLLTAAFSGAVVFEAVLSPPCFSDSAWP